MTRRRRWRPWQTAAFVVVVLALAWALTSCGKRVPETWMESEALSCEAPLDHGYAMQPVDVWTETGYLRIFPYARTDAEDRFVWVYGKPSAPGVYLRGGVDCDRGNPYDFARDQEQG